MSASRHEGMSVAVLAGLTLLASTLLFWVQPLLAKQLLPVFGGTPAVWCASLLFYQFVLLLGYAYVHALNFLSPPRQVALHAMLVLVTLALLPLHLPSSMPAEASEAPLSTLLSALAFAVGPLAFVLSSTAPLIQIWFSKMGFSHSQNPYPLYAASNAGSLGGLLAFPFILEPWLALGAQRLYWSWMYAVFALLCLLCAALLHQRTRMLPTPELQPPDEPIVLQQRLQWLLLSFVPASLVYGVTLMLTTDVAPVPLLWVVPLALYLLGFILAFAYPHASFGRLLGPFLPFVLLGMILSVLQSYVSSWSTTSMLQYASAHLAGFALVAFELHRRLSCSRPPPSKLTEFYLWVALGGILGGIFNTLVAPLIFQSVLEYPIALLFACLLFVSRQEGKTSRAQLWLRSVMLGAGIMAALMILSAGTKFRIADLGVYLSILLFLVVARRAFALSLVSILLGIVASLALVQFSPTSLGMLYLDRSFFGTHRIYYDEKLKMNGYQHGTTVHGRQSREEALRREPLSYFTRSGPLGDVIYSMEGRIRRVGAVGLGSGTVAAYAQPGQAWTFFEIDPAVEKIAKNPKLFTYLADMPAPPKILLGDGRLLLEAEKGQFDLLILDAFSSDSIPMHMLTREAFQVYLRKLAPKGILAFHITNRYLDLEPVLAAAASSLGLSARCFYDSLDRDGDMPGKSSSKWVAIARTSEELGLLDLALHWQPLQSIPGFKPWTDDWSNLLQVLKISE